MSIQVTKTFMPPIEKYEAYLRKIWDSEKITNQGPLLKEFESKIIDYTRSDYFHFVANGTLAIQVALKALDIDQGEVITTPFSYVATTSAILWQNLQPVYVDIDPNTLNIDPNKIEEAITPKTKAILAVHVFGNPCDIDAIDAIAKKHNLKVIYDAAHAFGVNYKGKSVFNYGDISITSFHATKPFHTVEGGGIFTQKDELNKKIELIKRFGHHGDEHFMIGLNAKASEFHAAMGLCNLEFISEIIEKRRQTSELYDELLQDRFKKQSYSNDAINNHAYYPVIFSSEENLLAAFERLNRNDIYPRRYFYPSLNTLRYLNEKQHCPLSEDIAKRIACLPLYYDISEDSINEIAEHLLNL